MKYKIYTIAVKDLLDLIKSDKLDLRPPYQRNEVWSRKDQEELMDSVLKGYPLPNFFFYKNNKGVYEMVDGQQRATTLNRFFQGIITDSKSRSIKNFDINHFLNYKLNITEIFDLEELDSINNFYVLVNKKGKLLNTPELFKAEYANTKFLELVENLLQYQKFMDLNLFTDATTKRMNDRSYVEELVAYLILGITDKKLAVEKIYKTDLSSENIEIISDLFKSVIDRVWDLNNMSTIKNTRYKQRNDFYTLFNFIKENLDFDKDLLRYQYKILCAIDVYIRPSQDNCEPLKGYAINCVSQSNSKNARDERLLFFNKILKNTNIKNDLVFQKVFNFLNQEGVVDEVVNIKGFDLFKLVEL